MRKSCLESMNSPQLVQLALFHCSVSGGLTQRYIYGYKVKPLCVYMVWFLTTSTVITSDVTVNTDSFYAYCTTRFNHQLYHPLHSYLKKSNKPNIGRQIRIIEP